MTTVTSTIQNSDRDNPYLLTLPQLLSAKKKIGKVAATYDAHKVSTKGFDSESLNPTEFREQLRRNFELNLTDAELGAIVVLCDKVNFIFFKTEMIKWFKTRTEMEW